MHVTYVFLTYQAEIAGTPYLAIPRETENGRRIDFQVLHPPDVGGIISASVSENGQILEASRLTADARGDEHLQIVGERDLAAPVRDAFRAIAAAVLGRNPLPIPYAAVDFLSIPRKRLEL